MKPLHHVSLLALAAVLLPACVGNADSDASTVESAQSAACGDKPSGGSAPPTSPIAPPTSQVRLKLEECTDKMTEVPLGATLIIDAPVGSEIKETMSLLGDSLPRAQQIEPGTASPNWWVDSRRTTFTYDLSSAKPELYLRAGRFLVKAPRGRYGRERTEWSGSCNVRVTDPRWRRVRTSDFFVPGTAGSVVEQTKNLGVIPRGNGLLLASGRNDGRGLLANALTPTPTRTSVISAGIADETVWVFDSLPPGDYSVDVETIFPGYGKTLTHLEFRFE